ncbi:MULTISPECIES: hypothetical protein [unclassified Chryseobacterium]|uniref:hypothetical protein n=1 Tax=unclassified Chryseobacterium TaxID=2593645 RepID=UPI0021E62550|nr:MULTISPECIES: hypothetical protein [unclassified Chryseobacterium]MEA1848474.1 hypothetical protein [Chryseobacterium sp. MHB01]
MYKQLKSLIFLLLPFFSLTAQNKVTEYLNIPGPITIDSKTYHLAWSSHPNSNYYKQEYLGPNDNIEKYNTLIMIDFVKGDFKLEDAINQKISELEKMKQSNPVINYTTYENKGEYILDFIISKNSANGKEILIAERNVYRYKLISDKNNNGILLFGVSERGYQEDIDAFFKNLKENSTKMVEVVGNYQLPEIKLK